MKSPTAILLASFAIGLTSTSTHASLIWINEIHYDNAGSDKNEFIEIAGSAGTDLTGWAIDLYNGTNGGVYKSFDLSGLIDNEGAGFGALEFLAPGIQNGAADGMALVDDMANVLQFLSYEGVLTAASGAAIGLISSDIGVSEPTNTPVGWSLQLTGIGSEYGDFSWNSPATASAGALNKHQILGTEPEILATVPEPSALALFTVALIALSLARRRASLRV